MKAQHTITATSLHEIKKSLDLKTLNKHFAKKTLDERLTWGYETFGRKIVVGTGFGSSGMVILHRIYEMNLPVKGFCLDTHLLFSETSRLWKTIEKKFNLEIEAVQPILTLEGQATQKKDKLWETDADACCYIRKVLPLKKYLSNKYAWITGLRRSQSQGRNSTEIIEWDSVNNVYKMNPLADWSADKVWEYIHAYKIPYNPLHDEGYPSIGCIPCTSPATDKNDERSGRWANLDKTECGIHIPLDRNKKD